MKFKRLFVFLFLFFMTCGSVFAQTKYVKVSLVGDYTCGKTCIWKRLFGEGFNPNERGSDKFTYRNIIKEDGNNILSLNIWDTAGADRFYDKVIDFVEDSNFVFIVHDLHQRFDGNAKTYLSRIYNDIHRRAPQAKILLVGSKYDLRHRNIANDAEQIKLVQTVAEAIPCDYVYTSAKENNDPGIARLLNYIIEQSRNMNLPTVSPRIVIPILTPPPAPTTTTESSSGCNIL